MIAQKFTYRPAKFAYIKPVSSGLFKFRKSVTWIVKENRTNNSTALKFTVIEWRSYFMPNFASPYLPRNFDKLIRGKEISRRTQDKIRAMMIMI